MEGSNEIKNLTGRTALREYAETIHWSWSSSMLSSLPIVGNATATEVDVAVWAMGVRQGPGRRVAGQLTLRTMHRVHIATIHTERVGLSTQCG